MHRQASGSQTSAPARLCGAVKPVWGCCSSSPGTPPPAAHVSEPESLARPWRQRPPLLCGRSVRLADRLAGGTRALRFADQLNRDGVGVDYFQDPPILTPDYAGRVWIRDLGIVGDMPTVTVRGPDGEETWPRVRTETVAGDTVSRFDLSWPASEVLRSLYYGYDQPSDQLGSFDTGRWNYGIPLRVAPPNLPRAPVRVINDHVQYSSHMVNLRVDTFTEEQLARGRKETRVTAAQLFFEHFPAVYDELAFSTRRNQLDIFGGSHTSVQRQVEGIGLQVFDDTEYWGLNARIKGINIFHGNTMASNGLSTHETLHQWVDAFKLAELAGYEPGGHEPYIHTALMFPHEHFMGAILQPTEEIIRVGGDLYELADVATPRQHPLHLYAMGLVPASAVPDMVVFEEQDHPSRGSLSGGSRIVTMADILAEYGPRTGPVQTEWRRGTVVVSEGGLLTQTEMDYWNFFAKRVGEPFHTMGSPGSPSFYESFDGRMRLRTDVAPKDHPALAWAEPTVLRDYAPTAWRGVVFDAPVPSWFRPHEPYTFQGEVVDDAYDRIEICLWQLGSDAECQQARLPAGGRFSLPHTFGEAGDYRVSVYLYDDPHDDDDRDSASAGVSGFVVAPCLGQAGPARVSLQAHDGHYLVAAPGGVVNATSATPGPWETFTVVDPNGGCVTSGDVVRLRASSRSYLQAVNGGGGVVDAAGTAAGPWGAFRLSRAQGAGPLRPTEMVRLQAPNGQYVVAAPGGGGVVNATSATPGPWETFALWNRE